MVAPHVVEFGYWSDPLCIWAFVAQDKLDRVLDELGTQLTVDYHVVPVFGSVPWRFAHGGWAEEGVDGRVAKTREIAAAHGHSEVSGAGWRTDPPASSWAPGLAIKAIQLMEAEGQVATGTTAIFQRRIRSAFFVDDRNVAHRTIQLELAEALDVPRDDLVRRLDDGSAMAALWEDHQEKERLRIQGSPTYVFDGGRAMLYGNFPFGILRATVEELVRGTAPQGSQC